MARARNIKPSLFTNEVLGVADPLLTILFISLWCLADKSGRLEDRPLRIKAGTFPYREGIDADKLLTDLERHGFIRRYSAGELRLIEILNFGKHQKPHHTEKESELPAFSDSCHVTVKTPSKDALIPDSLNTDSLIPEEVAATAAPVEDPVERRIWKDGIELLAKSALTEKQARPLLGRLARDYGNDKLAEAIAVTQAKNSVDPKTFLIGVLQAGKKDQVKLQIGKPQETVQKFNCKKCLDTQEITQKPRNAKYDWEIESAPCPDCKTMKEAA